MVKVISADKISEVRQKVLVVYGIGCKKSNDKKTEVTVVTVVTAVTAVSLVTVVALVTIVAVLPVPKHTNAPLGLPIDNASKRVLNNKI